MKIKKSQIMEYRKSLWYRVCKRLLRRKGLKIVPMEYDEHKYDSFSQEGEDRIVKMLLQSEKIIDNDVTYLDIGCNDPIALNNTFLLSRSFDVKKGVLVEPNTQLLKKMAIARPNDILINKGVGVAAGELSYYDFGDYHTLNTCSEEEKNFIIKQGFPIKSTTKIEIVPINDLLHEYFPDGRLDFLSIDIEGQDEEIIKSIDYKFIRPAIICIETAVYKGGKIDGMSELVNFFKSKDYYFTADTSLNSIFIDGRRSIHKRFLNDILLN